MLFPSNDNLKNLYKKISDFLLILIVLLFVWFIFEYIKNYERTTKNATFNYCQDNIKTIGTAMKLYAENNNGHYPINLKQLSPDYISENRVYCPGPGGIEHIIKCLTADRDVFLEYSYQVSLDNEFFTISCISNNHYPYAPKGYPYCTQKGLKPRP